ncbi:hypothetical protein BH11BAC7_BH11BAC7_34600 [soil metagenome]
MKKKLFILLISAFPFAANAQLGFMLGFEGGFAGSTIKSAELPFFFDSYNTANVAGGLTQPFKLKSGVATGRYFGFTVGMGGPQCKMTLIIDRYLMKSGRNEARFSNGQGRNMWTEIKETSSEVGVQFSEGKFTAGFEFVLSLRYVSIYSQYVFPDESTSFGSDHTLNGVFEDLTFGPGIGINVGYKVLPYLVLTAKSDYIFRVTGQHPEYHQYSDLQLFKDIDYLPRDFSNYNNYSGLENSISNDVSGLRFSFGIQFLLESKIE